MNIKYLFFIVLFSNHVLLSLSQSSYMVGTSEVSLEPRDDFFSLSLQAYGAPAEGRYTLEWNKKDLSKGVKYITGYKQYLILLSSNREISRKDMSDDDANWELLGP